MDAKNGFTFVELIMVVLILGILTAIAAPKLLNTSASATDNGLRQTLHVVRDAIDLFAMTHQGELPGADGRQGTFRDDLAPFLERDFPVCPIGPAQNDRVRIFTTDEKLVGVKHPVRGWRYNNQTGEFIANWKHATVIDPSINYDEL